MEIVTKFDGWFHNQKSLTLYEEKMFEEIRHALIWYEIDGCTGCVHENMDDSPECSTCYYNYDTNYVNKYTKDKERGRRRVTLRDKIIKILKSGLSFCIYCNTCGNKNKTYPGTNSYYCDDCHKENMNWICSDEEIDVMADEIIKEANL